MTIKHGMIVHPSMTMDGKYGASFGNHNKTAKSFGNLTDAKRYLINNGCTMALYDSPQGEKWIDLKKSVRKEVRAKVKSHYAPQRKPESEWERIQREIMSYGSNI